MAQIFHPSTNVISKLSIVGALLGLPVLGLAGYYTNMSYATQVGVPREQPVEFSHKHHVGDDGIDCRYCHSSVDKASFAGMPSTHTCMTCHSQIWTDSPELEPVRESFRSGRPIAWMRVHDLPDFAYFDHSIHVKKGVGCVSCHGRVDDMPLIGKEKPLTMEWCIECHRNPEKFVRPRDYVYEMGWNPHEGQPVKGEQLLEQYHVLSSHQLTNCSTCHR
jgi:hypothetical protein